MASNSDYPWYVRLGFLAGAWLMSAPPWVFIIVGAAIIGFGIFRYAAPFKTAPGTETQSSIAAPVLVEESGGPLFLAGTFAKGGKALKFFADLAIDDQDRGANIKNITIPIEEYKDFARGESVRIQIISYYNDDKTVLRWGPRSTALSIEGRERFQFTIFAKVKIFTLDENNREEKITSFVLYPRFSGTEYQKEAMGVMRSNQAKRDGEERARRAQQPIEPTQFESPPILNWKNYIIYREGELRAMDSGAP